MCSGPLSLLPSAGREMSIVATATGKRPSVADLGMAMVCLLAAPWVKLSVSASNGWPHNALRHHWLMPISCHFRDCKALLVTSLTYVSGAIASVQTFTSRHLCAMGLIVAWNKVALIWFVALGHTWIWNTDTEVGPSWFCQTHCRNSAMCLFYTIVV